MGYSPEFLRGVLALVSLAAAALLVLATADELLGLEVFGGGYPGGLEFGPFALSALAVIAVCWALGVLVDRFYG